MARIRMLSAEEFPASLADLVGAGTKTPLELGNIRFYAHRPELAEAYVRFMAELRRPGLLPRRLVELVRLRVAFHNQCRSCMAVRYADGAADGVDEGLVCQLATPDESPDLTPAERAALRFADRLATDHLSIDDATIDDLREHFDEAGIVELGMNVAAFVGYGRLSMALDMVEELPDRYRAPSGALVTPWDDGGADDAVLLGGPVAQE
ncbi:carboxymuconolactone decarboxylase family protein [Pseudonocardia broussonetiae]|nr:carboxymuconolactone decarboxylase family protein [Pseudonocardia broussonetiae]